MMKYVDVSGCADEEAATRKLVEIARRENVEVAAVFVNRRDDRITAIYAEPSDTEKDALARWQEKKEKIRNGEIALAALPYLLLKFGFNISENLKRNLGNMAAAIGVPLDEFQKFAEPILHDVLTGCLRNTNRRKIKIG
jgi:hypothetical protein